MRAASGAVVRPACSPRLRPRQPSCCRARRSPSWASVYSKASRAATAARNASRFGLYTSASDRQADPIPLLHATTQHADITVPFIAKERGRLGGALVGAANQDDGVILEWLVLCQSVRELDDSFNLAPCQQTATSGAYQIKPCPGWPGGRRDRNQRTRKPVRRCAFGSSGNDTRRPIWADRWRSGRRHRDSHPQTFPCTALPVGHFDERCSAEH